MTFEKWQQEGKLYSVFQHEVFAVRKGKDKPYLLILHGYPSCSYDYWHILPMLSEHFTVIVHDHLGFGLSDKPLDYSYSLIEQADIALALWQQMGVEEAHLLAHDYGTSVATEIIARRNQGVEPIRLLSATLGNGSMLINMAKLLPIQRILRNETVGPIVSKLANKGLFKRNMRRIWADKSTIDEAELDVLWQMIEYKDTKQVMSQISRYTYERQRFWHRWIGGLEQTDLPINILWADQDRIAVIEMAYVLQQKIKNNQLKIIEGVGHYPMLEAKEIYAKAVIEMISVV